MRPVGRLQVIAVTTTLVAVAQGASPQPNASTLWEEFNHAIGGREALARVTSLSAAGEFRRRAGDGTIAGKLQIALLWPLHFSKTRIETPAPGMSLTRMWLFDGITSTALIQGAPADGLEERSDAERDRLGALLLGKIPSGAELSYGGEAKSPDRTASVVDVDSPSGAFRMFIDPKTHRPLMLSYTGQLLKGGSTFNFAGADGQIRTLKDSKAASSEGAITLFVSDYLDIDGIFLPGTLSYSVNGTPLEEWTLDYKVNENLSPKQFQP
jgi:hypothetical protein